MDLCGVHFELYDGRRQVGRVSLVPVRLLRLGGRKAVLVAEVLAPVRPLGGHISTVDVGDVGRVLATVAVAVASVSLVVSPMSPVSVALLVAARDVFLLILDGGDRHLANSGDGKENGLDPLQCLCEEHRLHLGLDLGEEGLDDLGDEDGVSDGGVPRLLGLVHLRPRVADLNLIVHERLPLLVDSVVLRDSLGVAFGGRAVAPLVPLSEHFYVVVPVAALELSLLKHIVLYHFLLKGGTVLPSIGSSVRRFSIFPAAARAPFPQA